MGQSKKQWEEIQERGFSGQCNGPKPQAAQKRSLAHEFSDLRYYIAKAIEQEKCGLGSFAANTIERGALPALRKILNTLTPALTEQAQPELPFAAWVAGQIKHNQTQATYWAACGDFAREIGDESWANQCDHWRAYYAAQAQKLEKREEQKCLLNKMRQVGFTDFQALVPVKVAR